jgi:putative addiction module killer protein
MQLHEFEDERGRRPFGVWFESLDARAAARVQRALARLEAGNTSNVKAVGTGVFELKVDFGPGYRIYFGKDGEEIVILLGGGTKKRQQRDIQAAQALWQSYRNRKKA